MSIGLKPLRALALVVSLAVVGCHAQTAIQGSAASPVQIGVKLSPELQRRIELLIRSRTDFSTDLAIKVGEPAKSDIPGFDQITLTFAAEGKDPRSAPFLISTDGKTLAQLNKFDIGQNPMEKVSASGRPARGGPPNAPVLIVGFDDLECPYCAVMHAEIFPAVVNRYKDQVRIVYRDFPLEEIHPWAKHAAIDADCLASASSSGYWNFVDYVHAHASEIAGAEKTPVKADQNLDKLTLDEGARQKIDQPALVACVLKQDSGAVNQSVLEGEAEPLHIDSAPTLYINGEKVNGVVPIEQLYHIIDRALVAAGQTPPPMQTPTPPKPAPVAAKPGN